MKTAIKSFFLIIILSFSLFSSKPISEVQYLREQIQKTERENQLLKQERNLELNTKENIAESESNNFNMQTFKKQKQSQANSDFLMDPKTPRSQSYRKVMQEHQNKPHKSGYSELKPFNKKIETAFKIPTLPRFLSDSKLDGNEIIVKYEKKKSQKIEQVQNKPKSASLKKRSLKESAKTLQKIDQQRQNLRSIKSKEHLGRFEVKKSRLTKQAFERKSRKELRGNNLKRSVEGRSLKNQPRRNLKDRNLRDFRSFEKLERVKLRKGWYI